MFKLIQSPSKTELNHFQAGTQNSIHSLYCLKQGDLKWIQKNILNKLCPLYLALLCYLINQLTYQGFTEVDLGQSFLITRFFKLAFAHKPESSVSNGVEVFIARVKCVAHVKSMSRYNSVGRTFSRICSNYIFRTIFGVFRLRWFQKS